MRVATVFVLLVLSIIALCGAEDSSESNVSFLERESREAASPTRSKKSKNGRKLRKSKKNKAKKKRNSKKGLRKNKLRKNKKQRNNQFKRKNEKKRGIKKKNSKKISKAKNKKGNLRKQKKTRKQAERSSKNTCTDQEKDKARNFIKQAKQIQTWYKLLTNKGEKGGVFSNYSKTLEEMTSNGTICGATAKNALEFLTNCSATAKSSCDTSDFAVNETIAKDCENSVNCSNIPQQCKDTLKVTHDSLKDLRKNRCLDSNFPGSFSNCMKFIKGLGTDIIKDCVAEIKESSETCSGIIEEAGSSIILLTESAPSITTKSLTGRSRKRFY